MSSIAPIHELNSRRIEFKHTWVVYDDHADDELFDFLDNFIKKSCNELSPDEKDRSSQFALFVEEGDCDDYAVSLLYHPDPYSLDNLSDKAHLFDMMCKGISVEFTKQTGIEID